MNVALYGIGGLYNYGCEAIVRGAVYLIREVAPSANITYYSKRAYDDRVIISDLNINVVQLDITVSLIARILNRLFRITNIPYRVGIKSYNQILDNSNVIFSIGGDIYTIPAHKRSANRYEYYKELVQFGEKALKNNKKLIIYGASIGPFGRYKKANNYYFNHLKKVNLIVAREKECVEYLAQNGISDNVCFMPDPAFAVQLSNPSDSKPEYIGINLSPLSLNELYGGVSDNLIESYAKIISSIIRKTGMKVILIPHVFSPVNKCDNDLWFMERIYDRFDIETKDMVNICKPSSFIDAKNILKSCRFLISARMHCAINAVCEGIPTIFLSYSQKAKGMCNFVYGNELCLVSLKDFEVEIFKAIDFIINNEKEIKDYLIERIKQIRLMCKDSYKYERISDLLNDEKAFYKYK